MNDAWVAFMVIRGEGEDTRSLPIGKGHLEAGAMFVALDALPVKGAFVLLASDPMAEEDEPRTPLPLDAEVIRLRATLGRIHEVLRDALGVDATTESLAWMAAERRAIEKPPEGARAPICYVTPEGLVALPLELREHLGVEKGGGVVFYTGKEPGRATLVSHARAAEDIGHDDEEEP